MADNECEHGKKWTEKCAKCEDVWREYQVQYHAEQLRKFGFKVVPING